MKMFEPKLSPKYMLKFVFKYKWYFTKTRIIITTYLFKKNQKSWSFGQLDFNFTKISYFLTQTNAYLKLSTIVLCMTWHWKKKTHTHTGNLRSSSPLLWVLTHIHFSKSQKFCKFLNFKYSVSNLQIFTQNFVNFTHHMLCSTAFP